MSSIIGPFFFFFNITLDNCSFNTMWHHRRVAQLIFFTYAWTGIVIFSFHSFRGRKNQCLSPVSSDNHNIGLDITNGCITVDFDCTLWWIGRREDLIGDNSWWISWIAVENSWLQDTEFCLACMDIYNWDLSNKAIFLAFHGCYAITAPKVKNWTFLWEFRL